MVENPNLLIDDEENSDCEGPNPFEGDLAYVQAAEEQGWIRVKPMPNPVLDNSVFMETFSQDLNPAVAAVLKAAKENGLKLTLLTGGAIANRGFWVQRPIELFRIRPKAGYAQGHSWDEPSNRRGIEPDVSFGRRC
jgi:hypothetical protein